MKYTTLRKILGRVNFKDLQNQSLRSDFLIGKESLFAEVACLRGFPRRAKTLLAMTMDGFTMTIVSLALAVILSCGIVSEARAGVTCTFTTDPNDSTKFIFSAAGDRDSHHFTIESCNNQLPDGYSNWSDIKSKITSASFDDNIIFLGDSVFRLATSLTSITMPKVISIGNYAFNDVTGLTNITISDSLTSFGSFALFGVSFTDVNCIEDEDTDRTCAQEKSFLPNWFNDNNFHTVTTPDANCSGYSQGACGSCKSGYSLSGGVCVATTIPAAPQEPEQGESGTTETEVSCYEKGQVLWAGACMDTYPFTKKRYTPAEANEWLRDGNDNFVIITFKK